MIVSGEMHNHAELAGRIDAAGRYVIDDYTQRPPFASFLPGIAGPLGVPLWAFYVSRGQGMVSFGVESKDGAIVEFQPANKAYQAVSLTGFRTFLRLRRADGADRLVEPFGALTPPGARRSDMRIGLNDLQIVETDPASGVRTQVSYFVLPEERFAGLVRKLEIRNTSGHTLAGDLLDGLPAIIPFGVSNWLLKEMCNTVTAWMGVENLAAGVPFYRVATSIEDRPEVEEREAGHFYLCFTDVHGLLTPIVDPEVVFGANRALTYPQGLLDDDLAGLYRRPQTSGGKIPCGFFGTPFELAPGAALTLYAVIGHVGRVEMINRRVRDLAVPRYIESKHAEAVALADALTEVVAGETAFPMLDRYARQNFLDNVLRGGFPMLLPGKDRPRVQYLYSRRHGDLERDYNFFTVPAEYWSQGNGAYRDVNQNRRSDVGIEPGIDAHTIETFVNLIQADGYNPLELRAPQLHLDDTGRSAVLSVAGDHPALRQRLERPFTLGRLLNDIDEQEIPISIAPGELAALVIRHAEQTPQAVFHEGYWVDHWAYNLDLIDSYLAVYPDRRQALFFERKNFTYYDSAVVVPPRDRRYVAAGGTVRQFGTVVQDQEKAARIAARAAQPNLMRGRHGDGEIFRTHLFGKLFGVCALKFATLDPSGIGVEMEAGRPGWYDALNGLPALFGSSISETYELRRLVDMLAALAADEPRRAVGLPIEIWKFAQAVARELETLNEHGDDFLYWDAVNRQREAYRDDTRLGFGGELATVTLGAMTPLLAAWRARLQSGLEKARNLTGGLPPTYLVHEPTHWQVLTGEDGSALRNDRGQPFVRVDAFAVRALPLFLEGAVKALRTAATALDARKVHAQVQGSGLYDAKLGMYKVNASLADEPVQIGRTRAYTPGWLENESVFLHMHYKYLLALLQAGLPEVFWEEARRGLVPFMDPEVYGRSILENSSFIASSAHPDAGLHGRGFVARLSGSTAEFIQMWMLLTVGPQPFAVGDGGLTLDFRPALPGWLFKEDGTLRFTFLGKIAVTYHHPARTDLFPEALPPVQRVMVHPAAGGVLELPGMPIAEPWASRIRERAVSALDVYWDMQPNAVQNGPQTLGRRKD